MGRCKDCALHTKCSNPLIMGRASNSRPKYMVILDYPTKQDDRFDQSPSGDVEAKLKYFCDRAGINYNDVYVTNAIKCAVPKDKTKDIKKEHLEACSQYLLTEILKYKPRVIIPSGKTAFQMLSGFTSVDEFVGHDYDFTFEENVGSEEYPELVERTYKTFPIYSVNSSLFVWENNFDIILALKKAKRFVVEGIVERTRDPKVNLVLSTKDLRLMKEELLDGKVCATDLETTGLTFWKNKIINAGYCTNVGSAWVVYHTPYAKQHIKKWTKEEIELGKEINLFLKHHQADVVKTTQEIHSSHLKFILHNMKFDAKFCAKFGFPYNDLYMDTLLADSLIDENMGHSLNECYVRRNINYGPYDVGLYPYVGKKDQKNYQNIPPQMIIKYLGYDVDGVRRMAPVMQKELKEENLWDYFMEVKMPSLKEVLLPIEYRGVRYDKPLLLKSSATIKALEEQALTRIREITKNPEFNPNSDVQISNYMVDAKFPLKRLDIPKTSRGYSTKKENLKKFLELEKYKEFPELILKYKQFTKIKGTYIDGKNGDEGMLQYIDKDNLLHPNFNMWTAVTGRYSCNKPSLQTFPRPIKNLINTRTFVVTTHPDWIMFEADFSALEQYVVAALSKDDVLIGKILDGTDIHSFNATTLGKALRWIDNSITYEKFVDNCGKGKVPVEEIDKEIYQIFSDLRTKAKTVGFGLNYGKGAKTFAEEFGITEAEAIRMIEAYFYLYKKMYRWREKIVEQAYNKGFITLLSGRKRRFKLAMDWINSAYAKKSWSAKIIKEEIARQTMNFPIQGGAHEAFEEGCLRLVRRFKKEGLKAHLQLSIHDGIVGSCPPEEKEMVTKCIKEEMIMTYNAGTPYELTLEIDVGFYKDRWYGEKLK